jgi:hypothetical protein
MFARMVAVSAAAVLCGLGGLHLYWAGGGRWGTDVAIPKRASGAPTFVPGSAATLLVSMLLFAAALVFLGRVELGGQLIPKWLFAAGAWVLVVVFSARVVGDFRWFGLFKRTKGTPFAWWDSTLYIPLSGLLALAALVVATT